MKKIDVLMVMPFLSGGGAEKVFSEIANHFADNELNVKLIITSKLGDGVNDLDPRISLKFLDVPVKKCIFSLIREIKKTDPKVVFSNFLKINLIIGLALRLRLLPKNIRYIGRENNIPSVEMTVFNYPRFVWWLYKYTYMSFDIVIAQSKDMALDMTSIMGLNSNAIRVINNPPPNANPFVCNVNLSNKRKMISIGRLVYQKGYDLLIQSMVHLPQEYTLDIYGSGDKEEELKQLILDCKLSDRISFKGFVDKQTISKAINASDVLVLSSRYEGYPNVLLEALSHSTPIVAFDIKGGINEIVLNGVNGFITPCFDFKKMAENIVLSCNLERDYIAKDFALRFSRRTILNEYLSLINDCD